MIYIPNQKIFNDTVTNSSVRPNRRLDIDFFIPYDQDCLSRAAKTRDKRRIAPIAVASTTSLILPATS